MKKCNKCNISINGLLEYCPLCQNKLEGKGTLSLYPKNEKRDKNILLFKIIIFISLVTLLICGFLDYKLTDKFDWSMFVLLGLITVDATLIFVLKNYKNVLKLFERYFLIALILLFLWHFVTGIDFLIIYIIPGVCILILLFNSITQIVLSGYTNRNIDSVFFNIIIGFLPIGLKILKFEYSDIMVSICTLLNIIIFFVFIVFFREKFLNEINKKFKA